MNKKLSVLIASTGVLMILLAGCYTQLSTTRDDDRNDHDSYSSRERDESDSSAVESNDEGYNDGSDYRYDNSYNDGWHHHSRIGFSYYYPSYWPSTYFAAAYADPWYFGLGCDPFWFSSPYYYPMGGYYSPWYGYYQPFPYYGYHGFASYPYSVYKSRIRTFGADRTGSRGRAVSGGRDLMLPDRSSSGSGYGNLPTGMDLHGGSAQPVRKSTGVNAAPRTGGNARVASPRRNADRNNARVDRSGGRMGSRGSITRGASPRDTQPVYHPPERTSSTPPTSNVPPHRDNGARYSPPARSSGSAPRSSPPPSGASSQPNRGGSTRGVRP